MTVMIDDIIIISYDKTEVTFIHLGGHQPDENTQRQDPADRVGPIVYCDD